MTLDRRTALKLAVLATTAGPMSTAFAQQPAQGDLGGDWNAVRRMFDLSEDRVHMSAMLLSSHPHPVQDAIERHRRELDANPVEYLEQNNTPLTEAAREAAAAYLGVHASHVALTDSTTAGIGLVYGGLVLRQGQELLTTSEDYFVTHEALRLAAERSGATTRQIDLYEDAFSADTDQIVGRIMEEIRPETRLLALTWVHSSTGMKIPAAAIAAGLAEINAGRDEGDQVLFGLAAVHGFGIETDTFLDLGCDFYMAGCHKWLFGPRGTGIAVISDRGLAATRPVIPSFTDDGVFTAWLQEADRPPGRNDGQRMTPGGFKPFEHRWALTEAFDLHATIGRARVADRTHQLAGQLKQGLLDLPRVRVHTPMASALSAGIVSLDVEGQDPNGVVAALRERGIVASVAPYATPHVRLTPSIRNTEAEVEQALAAVAEL